MHVYSCVTLKLAPAVGNAPTSWVSKTLVINFYTKQE